MLIIIIGVILDIQDNGINYLITRQLLYSGNYEFDIIIVLLSLATFQLSRKATYLVINVILFHSPSVTIIFTITATLSHCHCDSENQNFSRVTFNITRSFTLILTISVIISVTVSDTISIFVHP